MNLCRAGQYYMLAGLWPLSDNVQNELYPSVTPETFRDFLQRERSAS